MTIRKSPIAIVGLGTMFAGRGTTSGFWRDMIEGIEAVENIPQTHWRSTDFFDPDSTVSDKTYSDKGCFIPHFAFDPVEFGIPPQVVETTDTVQLRLCKWLNEQLSCGSVARTQISSNILANRN